LQNKKKKEKRNEKSEELDSRWGVRQITSANFLLNFWKGGKVFYFKLCKRIIVGGWQSYI
jgi:hypothetical protein